MGFGCDKIHSYVFVILTYTNNTMDSFFLILIDKLRPANKTPTFAVYFFAMLRKTSLQDHIVCQIK